MHTKRLITRYNRGQMGQPAQYGSLMQRKRPAPARFPARPLPAPDLPHPYPAHPLGLPRVFIKIPVRDLFAQSCALRPRRQTLDVVDL